MRRSWDEAQRREQQEARADFVGAVQLDQAEDECVAFDPAASACLVTVAEFNRSAESWPPVLGQARQGASPSLNKDLPVEALRRDVLHSLLAGAYLENRLAQDPGQDSLNKVWQARQERRLEAERREIGDSTLRSLYRSRFERDFKGREERIVQVLGMSDSALADSLWRVFSAAPGGPKAVRPERAWKWRSPVPADLPPGAQALIATLRKGEISKPLRTPYGYLLLRWLSVHRQPPVRFEDALPLLVALSRSRPVGAGPEAAARESRVEAYYRTHQEDFRSPDTARYRILLLPDAAPGFSRGSRAGDSGLAAAPRAGKGGDGFRLRLAAPELLAQLHAPRIFERCAVEAGYFDLPASLQAQLGRYFKARPGEVLGPFPSVFGTWWFQVLETRPGGRLSTLREARQAVLAALGEGEPGSAQAEGLRSRDRQGWGLMAAHYLEERFGREAARDTAAGQASGEASRRMAADKTAWMRHDLDIRFIALEGF
ncbi:MAG TPA: peptidylprolyl isomerase [Fibrobacteria bacterium]|nr:peptidylprolyl isomerase [Fibrobacteria bacterium]